MPDPEITLTPARELDRALLLGFAPAVWPSDPPEKVLSRWWLTSDLAVVTAALDKEAGRIAAICVGVRSRWRLPGGELAKTISICGWYVHPAYAGLGLGRMLVRSFEEQAPYLNTLSISDAAVRGFARMAGSGRFGRGFGCCPCPCCNGPGWHRLIADPARRP